MAASTVVLGSVLVVTGYMLTKSVDDNARRQMHAAMTGRQNRDEQWSMDDIVYANQRGHQRELEAKSGIIRRPPPPRRDGSDPFGPPRRSNDRRSGDRRTNRTQDSQRRDPSPVAAPSTPPKKNPAPSTVTTSPTASKSGPADQLPRQRMFMGNYTNDGKPYPGTFFSGDLMYEGKPLTWPATLDEVTKLPSTILYSIAPDTKGRFKLLCLYDVSEQYAQLAGFKLALLALFPIMVGILGAATYLGIGISFRPLHKLLVQASTMGLDDRMEVADQAEFGELASSLNSYLDRIEKVVRQQEEFAVDAAHELSTPLTALRGQLELALLKKNDAEAYGEAAQSAIAQVTRLTRLVESLLLATRPRDVAVTPVDVQDTLGEVQSRWVDRYAARHVDLQLSAEAFKARMPQEELESVMENLLANALKFSPTDSTVTITLDKEGKLVVQDQGPGIPEADRERVFERFERGTTKARGFGIGLYLVRRLLEQRGGAIRVGDSTKGARIEVALPA